MLLKKFRSHPPASDNRSQPSGTRAAIWDNWRARAYSVVLISWHGRQTRNLAVSRKAFRCLLAAAALLLGLSGWLVSDYVLTKLRSKEETTLRTRLHERVASLSAQLEKELKASSDLRKEIESKERLLAKTRGESEREKKLRVQISDVATSLRAQVKTQREKLLSLSRQLKASRQLLANWKGLRKRVQDSLPRKRRPLMTGQEIIDELETSIASLQGDLKGLIASIPSEWPAKGWISSGFGRRRSPWTGKADFHPGIDIANRSGTPVRAPGDGVVKFAGHSNGTGKSIIINHGQGITTLYGHLSKILVKKGDRVHKNQKIAKVGNTGRSTNPHLHYEVRVNGVPINPRKHLLKQTPPSS